MNWVEAIREFQGIIGALLGTVVTLVTTKILGDSGKINIRNSMAEIKYFEKDEIGGYYETTGVEWSNVTINGEMLIHNTSESIKSIYDIHLKITTDNGIEKASIKDESTIRRSAGVIVYDNIGFLNLHPKKNFEIKWIYRGKPSSEIKNLELCYTIADKKFFPKKSYQIQI